MLRAVYRGRRLGSGKSGGVHADEGVVSVLGNPDVSIGKGRMDGTCWNANPCLDSIRCQIDAGKFYKAFDFGEVKVHAALRGF
jgi:hypothetical protein